MVAMAVANAAKKVAAIALMGSTNLKAILKRNKPNYLQRFYTGILLNRL
jgi:hypothetical protein